MKILHIQYVVTVAGNAPFRLNQAMREKGIDSYIMNLSGIVDSKFAINYHENYCHRIVRCVIEKLDNITSSTRIAPNQYQYHKMPILSRGFINHHLIQEADVIYIHWVAIGASFSDLEYLCGLGKPVIVFLHDMWFLTGGCHYSLDCVNYKEYCQDCRMFLSGGKIAEEQIKLKSKLCDRYDNIYFVSPSQWMKNCADNSSVSKNRESLFIPNYIDDRIFRPIDREKARKALNLPQDKIIISFGCQSGHNNQFKGWQYLVKALRMLPYKKDEVLLLVYGSKATDEVEKELAYPGRFLGRVNDEQTLALIDNASDVFVSPSLGESFGMTLLENILCNTPVVSFNNTAIPETVVHLKTGYLAENKNAIDLAKGIEWAIKSKTNVKENCKYSSESTIQQHLTLLNSFEEKNSQ